MSVRRNGRQVADVIEKLRVNHNKNALRGRNKRDPSSETTKLRKRNKMFERAELLSMDNYKAQIIMLIHFPNTKQSTTYGKAFGNVAQSFLDAHKSVAKKFYDFCNAADQVPGDSSEEANPHIFPNSDDSIEKAGTHIIPNSDDFSKEVCPENSSNLGETGEEAVFENTETLTTTSEKVLIEMGFDKGEEELTTLDMLFQKYGDLQNCEIVSSQTTCYQKTLKAPVAGKKSPT
ncbi:Uncharacterized protein APZ42_017718 [Daphnia magna]|uniref:Uncharacterized protein n=1 Tax=Daphnia magna TaxID=35525 RepID=A0A164ZMZ4_9CRUS|nr:Uncharacterized protein APZ42_017718 [Daphnia magna]